MGPEDAGGEHTWTARNVRPVVAVYLAGVFVGFMALAHFVFHSPEAVKALLLAAVPSVAGLVPSMLVRTEYRITDAGLAKKRGSKKGSPEFKVLFLWEELSHVVPNRMGFKYFKKTDEPNPVARFFKLHFSDAHSGEFHVEATDLAKVRALLAERAVPILAPGRPVEVKKRI